MKKKLIQSKFGVWTKEDMAHDLDALIMKLPKDLQKLRHKAVTSSLESVDTEKRTEVSVITTDNPDLENDVILAKGIDRTTFQRNPIVCLSHDMRTQVGTCDWIKPTLNGLKAQTKYPSKPSWYEEQWLPDHVLACIQSGLLQGKSIGFMAKNVREPSRQELEQRPDWQGARVIDECILLEYSVCSAGINQDAVVTAIAKGLKQESLKALGIRTPKERKSLVQRLEEFDWEKYINDTLIKMTGRV